MIYSVADVVDTLLGEGCNAGRRAVVVRFVGCNLWNGRPEHRASGAGECARWCDASFENGEKVDAIELSARMANLWRKSKTSARLCVLTGGEPMLQVDAELVCHLQLEGWEVAVETNGTVTSPAFEFIDHVTVSPKLGDTALAVYEANELKIVLPGAIDGARGWPNDALVALENLGDWGAMFVQPQDPIDAGLVATSHLRGTVAGDPTTQDVRRRLYRAHVNRCIEFVRAHPTWRLSLQTHKILGLP